jgi:c-di-GMP-binding flagellar brake protein YcgR
VEKRRYQRVSREVTVDINYVDPSTMEDREVERSCSRNLSAVGLKVTSDQKLEVGHAVEVKFYMPDSEERLTLRANVVWVEELVENKFYDMGLEFIDIDDKQIEKINSLVVEASQEQQ